MNVTRAADLVTALVAGGVREFCVCPGGRNAPIALVLARAGGVPVRTFFDERSAAFFALGRIKASGAPVAVVTTSGTAAAELLPAAVEAYCAGLPLVLVTADRPPTHRGTGGPQAIEQVGLYGSYAPTIFDGATARDTLDLAEWTRRQPVHVNICFDEPLVDGPLPDLVLAPASPRITPPSADATPVTAFLAAARRPLAVLGPLDAADREGMVRFLVRWGAPVYAEPASGLREHPALAGVLLTSGEGALHTAGFDAVLRLGGVPTLRLWRDLEGTLRDVRVCSVARTPFPGLTHGTHVHAAPADALRSVTAAPESLDGAWRDALLARDRRRRAALDALWETEPAAEPVLVHRLSALVPANALVYLGNSLPIREWDLAALRDPPGWDVAVNRGANGIDGQLSTFFGLCGPDREHWALVGDLTTLYDLAAPWILPQVASGPVRVVVINNGGGQIFARLSPHAALRNEHGLGFAHWARMWGLAHERWERVPARPRLAERCVIELVPDPAATARWWQALDRLAREP